jgi:hypothetical protein
MTLLRNCLAVIVALPLATLFAGEPIVVIPGEVQLTGPEARQQLLVERILDDRLVGQAADPKWSSSNEAVVVVEDGVLVPKSNGVATVTAKAGDQSASAKVKVTEFEKPHSWLFRNHVLAIFAKAGCNSGS